MAQRPSPRTGLSLPKFMRRMLFTSSPDEPGGQEDGWPAPALLQTVLLVAPLLCVLVLLPALYKTPQTCLLPGEDPPAQYLGGSILSESSALLRTSGGGDSDAVVPDAITCSQCNLARPEYSPPEFDACQLAVVGGRKRDGYGAWPLCGDHLPPNSTIYSVGIGTDVSFDSHMIREGHSVFGFDPTVTPASVAALFRPGAKEQPQGFSFMQVGLGSSNGVVKFLRPTQNGLRSMTLLQPNKLHRNQFRDAGFLAPVLTLDTFMAALKHDHVDLLKVDVEGAEFDVCKSPQFLETLRKVGQVICEFHERMLARPAGQIKACVKSLEVNGFSLVNTTRAGEYVFARIKKRQALAPSPGSLSHDLSPNLSPTVELALGDS